MRNLVCKIAAESINSLTTLELHAMNVDDEVSPYGSTTVTVENFKKRRLTATGLLLRPMQD
ncbi:uncharacterized protein BDW47DRAFT_102977 [Aspergillus candidus]|uniref:Uncharacterized protein n=1 Tax=Aspergillus candidus TaxID=41067 RepID=A0A2I2FGH3_ASPCN|nr:hypothetical protein BDW47DRAFT_102977 [Aspergillus candidus]PLB39725.1 hypothetical protein BDW47DRAFT_102977 [Aspergillus candidus]